MKKFEEMLKQEANSMLPNDHLKNDIKRRLFEDISTCNDVSVEKPSTTYASPIAQASSTNQVRPRKANAKSKTFSMKAISAMAAVVCLVVSLTLGLYFTVGQSKELPVSNTYISIDINPSFEIVADKNDIVTSVKGLNKDAVIVLFKTNYVGKPIGDVCEALILSSIKLGYLKDGKDVNILAVNDNSNKETSVIATLKSTISTTAKSKDITAHLVVKNETIGGDNDGKDGQPTNGKQAMLDEACKILGITQDEAKNYTIAQLNKKIKEKLNAYTEAELDALEDKLEDAFEKGGYDDLDEDALEDALDKLKEDVKETDGDDDDDDTDDDTDTDSDGDADTDSGKPEKPDPVEPVEPTPDPTTPEVVEPTDPTA
ncbi:MAG: hypothetical protein RSC44_02575, partial [Clostridia bacterium]